MNELRHAPDATEILPVNASREDWLLQRRKGLGGTDSATLAGVNKFGNEYEVWVEKTTDVPPVEEDKDIFWWGHAMEPIMLERFEQITGLKTLQVGTFVNNEHPELYVNPDAFEGTDGIIECKTTEWYTDSGEIWDRGEIPGHPMVQLQKAMLVTGRKRGWIIALVGRSLKIHGPIERDETMIAEIRARELAWWHRHVVEGVAPPLDPTSVSLEELALRFPEQTPGEVLEAQDHVIPDMIIDSFVNFASIRDRRLELEKEEKSAKAELQSLLGTAETLKIFGRPAATWKTQAGAKYTDVEAMAERLAELEGRTAFEVKETFTKHRAPTRVLRPATAKGSFDYTTYITPALEEAA